MNAQVRKVQWALLKREPKAKRMAWLLDIHGEWVQRLHASRGWPVDAMLEMLLLTEGDEEEVDKQLTTWIAQRNHLLPRTGGVRDYQQFLSVLHAQHQLRLHDAIMAQDAQDRRLARKREDETAYDRVGKLTREGTRT